MKEEIKKSMSKKELAKVFFVDMGLSQKDTAERLGVNPTQVNRWVLTDKWDALKMANQVTAKQVAQHLYKRILEISKEAEEQGRTITVAEVDQISKLNACIRDLDKSADLPTYMEAFDEFLTFMKLHDDTLVKELSDYTLLFLTQKAKELSKNG